MCFRIASGKKRIASDLGVCDSNRIARRGCIARFGPLSAVLQNLLQQAFYYVKRSAEPSCRTSKAPQNSGQHLEPRTRLPSSSFFSSQMLLGRCDCFKPGCLQFLRGSALSRSFALCYAFLRICTLLRSLALFCAHLRASASDSV